MATLSDKDLGKYHIDERIDSGGMAEVYLGVHKQLDRQVAIKVMHGHLLEGGDFLARFRREAKAVAKLRHPNIVQVLDFDVKDEIIFMVMEYIEGTNLQKRLNALHRQGECLSIAKIGSIIKDVADALDYAHSKGMLHRDVKPSNILLDKNDKAYLTDFGIAKILSDQKFTATGTLIGTPAYMSPEQGTGEELSKESDIYSLGVVAFEMITGQVPYDAPTPIGIVHKQVYDPIPDIADLVDDVPESTQEVIDTALAKSPDSRYPSADALVTALRGALVALEAADPTLKETVVEDPKDEDKAQYAATEMMEEPPKTEELDQATGLMEETEAAQQEEELSTTIVDPGIEDQIEEVESERKIPIWGVVIGVVVVIGIVGVVLSQIIGSRPSLTETEPSPTESSPTQFSSDSIPIVTESSSEVDSEFSGRTVAGVNPQSSDGVLVFRDAGGDADLELVAVDGEVAWRTGTGRILPSTDYNQTADYYMIVDVDDEFIYRGAPTSDVVIELEYLDHGIDRFRLEYDAVAGGPSGDGQFKETDWVSKTDSGEFKPAVFYLDDAYFSNRIHGGDFRLNDDADGLETIRSVSVTLPSLLPDLSGEEHYYEGERLMGLDIADEALMHFDLALAAGYETASLYHDRGFANSSLGHIDEAIEDWSRAISLDGNKSEYWLERGIRRSENGDLAGAIEDLMQAVEIDPDNVWNHFYIGLVYFNYGEDRYMDEAMDALDHANELDPTNTEVLALRGLLEWEAFGDAYNAQRYLNLAIENANPDDPGPYNMRGLFYLQSGQFERCVEDYTKFLELEPGNPYGYLERGDCYAGLGEVDLAKEDYESFLGVTEGDPEFAELIQRVEVWLDGH